MGTLYLLRHAKSSWDDPALADHDRPLAPRGRRNASALAEHVRREAITPALVLCSTAVRARETLAVVLPAIDVEAEIRLEDGLYGASADDVLARLRSVTAESVLVVGHNPTLEDLAARLAP
jgi:phosphohistidine phosphatase